MAEMQDYDFSNPSDRQAFQRFIIELIRNEINSYTKQTQNSNPNPSASLETGVLPSGVIVPFAGGPGVTPNPGTLQDVPVGWLLCAGTAISRNAYSALFAAVGTTYGVGDGSTTFNVPDLRGRLAAGKDNMGGTAASRITNTGTDNSGILASSLGVTGGDQRMHQHTHTQNSHSHAGLVSQIATPPDGSYAYMGNPATAQYSQAMTSATATNQNTGTGAAQNMPPVIILNYLIKT